MFACQHIPWGRSPPAVPHIVVEALAPPVFDSGSSPACASCSVASLGPCRLGRAWRRGFLSLQWRWRRDWRVLVRRGAGESSACFGYLKLRGGSPPALRVVRVLLLVPRSNGAFVSPTDRRERSFGGGVLSLCVKAGLHLLPAGHPLCQGYDPPAQRHSRTTPLARSADRRRRAPSSVPIRVSSGKSLTAVGNDGCSRELGSTLEKLSSVEATRLASAAGDQCGD